ncbi:hypothetical protein [Galactobacter valiniphilus]|uniref:hypothetical protein n=1 Tax=Galactobacter valiniphilus TaxID=2676122 RepID=UPI001F37CDED|nr:hypothetical protein [Galactobacter valiniphilus]
MKKKFVSIAALAATTALALSACAGGSTPASSSSAAPPATDKSANAGKSITLWLAGGDTSDELREYLKTTFNEKTGATLKIEE